MDHQPNGDFYDVQSKGIRITNTLPEFADELEALQHLVFPHLKESEILHAAQYRKHVEVFPEGQLVALSGNRVAGATTTMRYRFLPGEHPPFFEIMGGGWLTTHDPEGDWLYGIDVSVHPEFRRKGIAKAFYRARHRLCRKLNLKGQMTVGLLNGFVHYRSTMAVEEYYHRVAKGEIFDPTVSVQQKIGFVISGLAREYLHDPTCGNAGAILMLPVEKNI